MGKKTQLKRARVEAGYPALEGVAELSPTGVPGGAHAVWLLWGAAAFAAVYTVVNCFLFVNLSDEGVAAMDGWRIALGQLPHRDFFEIVPPLSFYPTALAIKALGPTVLAVRSMAVLLGLALLWAIDLVVTRFTRDAAARAMALLAVGVWGVSMWPCPSHHWYSSLFHLLVVFALIKSLEPGRGFLWGLAAGAATAADVLSLHDQGAYFLLGLLVLFFPLIADQAVWKRSFLGWITGGLAVGLPAVGALISAIGVKDIWYQLAVWPMSQYRQIPGNQFSAGDLFKELGELHREAGLLEFSKAVMMDFLPWIALAAVLAAFINRLCPRPLAGLLAAATLSALGSLLHRLSVLNIHWILPVLLPPACLAFSHLRSGREKALRRLGTAAVWIGIAASGLYGARFFAGAIFGGELSRMRTPAGTFLVYTPGGGSPLSPESELIDAVKAAIPAGEPVFTRGFIPYINYLTGHPNPTRYNWTVHPLAHTDSQAREMVKTLDDKRVGFIVGNVINTGPSLLDDYILANYDIVWRNEGYLIFKRR